MTLCNQPDGRQTDSTVGWMGYSSVGIAPAKAESVSGSSPLIPLMPL